MATSVKAAFTSVRPVKGKALSKGTKAAAIVDLCPLDNDGFLLAGADVPVEEEARVAVHVPD